jgi:hypothetical protein
LNARLPVWQNQCMYKVARTFEVSKAVEQLQAEYDLSIEIERWAEYERTGELIDLDDARKRLGAKLKAQTWDS